jgi:hypothetical protein
MKIKLQCMAGTVLLGMGLLCGCKQESTASGNAGTGTQTNAADIKESLQQLVDVTQEKAGQAKTEFVASMNRRLESLDRDMSVLEARLDGLVADVKVEATQAMNALREQRAALGQKLEQLEKAGDQTWEQFKDGVEVAAQEVKAQFEALKSKWST